MFQSVPPENAMRFSDISSGYRNGTLSYNGLSNTFFRDVFRTLMITEDELVGKKVNSFQALTVSVKSSLKYFIGF